MNLAWDYFIRYNEVADTCTVYALVLITESCVAGADSHAAVNNSYKHWMPGAHPERS